MQDCNFEQLTFIDGVVFFRIDLHKKLELSDLCMQETHVKY